MTQLFTNNAISLLTGTLFQTESEIHVIPGDGSLFPQPINPGDFFLVTLEDQNNTRREIIKISGRTGDTLHVASGGRGFDGSHIYDWEEDTLVDHRITAYELRRIEQLRGNITDPNDPNIIQQANSKICDTFAVVAPNNLSCKWIVTAFHEATGRISIAELLAAYRGPTNSPSFTVYAKTGDKLKYDINVTTSGTNMRLTITNTDTVALRINSIRINY